MLLGRNSIVRTLKHVVTSVQGLTGDVLLSAGSVNAEPSRLDNLTAINDPGLLDDESKGYQPLSKWVNTVTGEIYSCMDAKAGAAVWRTTSLNLSDLGTAATMNVGDSDSLIPTTGIVKTLLPTRATLGLNSIDNTADSDKPVSVAQALAIKDAVDKVLLSLDQRVNNINYSSIQGLPILFDGNYSSLSGLPSLFDGKYSSLSNAPTLFDGKYSSLIGLPTLFDGEWSSIKNKPPSFDGSYSSLSGTPMLFSGKYDDLLDRPTIPTMPTRLSQLTNDSGYARSSEVPTKTSQLQNDSNYVAASSLKTKLSEFVNDAGFLKQSELPTLVTIPTAISAFSNDVGYAKTSEVPKTTDALPEGSTNLYYTRARIQAILDEKFVRDCRYYTVTTDSNGFFSVDLSSVFKTIDFVDPQPLATMAGVAPVITEQRFATWIASSAAAPLTVRGMVSRSNLITTILIGGVQGLILGGAGNTVRLKVEGILK